MVRRRCSGIACSCAFVSLSRCEVAEGLAGFVAELLPEALLGVGVGDGSQLGCAAWGCGDGPGAAVGFVEVEFI